MQVEKQLEYRLYRSLFYQLRDRYVFVLWDDIRPDSVLSEVTFSISQTVDCGFSRGSETDQEGRVR